MALKIDLEDAYNRLSWDFLLDMLKEVVFDNSWVRNIMARVETSRMVALWNGEQLGWFKLERGVR